MKIISLTLLLLFFLNETFAQHNNTWISFFNKDSTLIGFKDKAGKIKIKPKFSRLNNAQRFDNIMGVEEEKDGKITSYYLTKSGKVVGKNNLYIFDNGADCENDWFIRFRDKKTHKVGVFNGNGDIAIPAIYDDLIPVRNGMIPALEGGHWDISQQSEHNEFPWVGSKPVLIDVHNKVLIDKFQWDENIDFYSLIISDHINTSPVRQNYRGINGKYYSFINFDKEFKAWLKDSLLNNLSRTNLQTNSYRNITIWDKTKGWTKESKKIFFAKNFEIIKEKLTEVSQPNCDYNIFTEGLNPYTYCSHEFQKYFDNCGQSKDWIYPLKVIVINHKINNDILQDHIIFLRTDKGYKLIEISLKVGEPLRP